MQDVHGGCTVYTISIIAYFKTSNSQALSYVTQAIKYIQSPDHENITK